MILRLARPVLRDSRTSAMWQVAPSTPGTTTAAAPDADAATPTNDVRQGAVASGAFFGDKAEFGSKSGAGIRLPWVSGHRNVSSGVLNMRSVTSTNGRTVRRAGGGTSDGGGSG
ncbi:unnamed protein product, partial [Phaeothamnion confervicola]